MTRDADIIRSRAAVRREVALAAWHAIKSELEALGLELTLFGSLAKGGFSAHSDIDVSWGIAAFPDRLSIVSSEGFRAISR